MNYLDTWVAELAHADEPFAREAAALCTRVRDVTSEFLAHRHPDFAEDSAPTLVSILDRAHAAAQQAEQAAAAELVHLSDDPALYLNTEQLTRAVALAQLFTLNALHANALTLIDILQSATARGDAAELVAITCAVNSRLAQLAVMAGGEHGDVRRLRTVLKVARVAALPSGVAERRKAAEVRRVQAAQLRNWIVQQQTNYTAQVTVYHQLLVHSE